MSIARVYCHSLDKAKWDELVASCSGGTVFTQSWYIDIVSKNSWWAYIAVNDSTNEWEAAIPVLLTKKMANEFSRQPLLSKYWGVLVRDNAITDNYKKIHNTKEQMAKLLAVAADVAVFDYFTSINPTYVPQYKWQNFNISPRFTYVIDLKIGIESIRAAYSKTVRKKVAKLRKNGFENRLKQNSEDLEEVLVNNINEGRKLIPANAIEPLKLISKTAFEKGKGFFLSTYSPENELAGAGFFLFDNGYTHFLSGYVNPKFRNENVMNLLVDGALNRSTEISHTFDFFGSSIESIEAFFRSFGSVPKPYYRVVKCKFPFNFIWKA